MIEIKIVPTYIGYASNMYLILSENEAAVVDPSGHYDLAKRYIGERKVKYIMLTHAHFDHMLEIDDWVKNTDATVIVGRSDAAALSDPIKNCYRLFFNENTVYSGSFTAVSDKEVLFLEDTKVEIFEVPGHTPGSLIYKIDSCAFVGDLVFAEGGFGRYDLPGGNFSLLKESIKKLSTLDLDTRLYPGHGPMFLLKDMHINIGD